MKATGNHRSIALVCIGNSLRSDDGVASKLCDLLPESVSAQTKKYDLGLYTGLLADCLDGHQTALIVDASKNGKTPGTVYKLDLLPVLKNRSQIILRSCHGMSIIDELKILPEHKIPNKLWFFGIEVTDTSPGEELSQELKSMLPELRDRLAEFILELC